MSLCIECNIKDICKSYQKQLELSSIPNIKTAIRVTECSYCQNKETVGQTIEESNNSIDDKLDAMFEKMIEKEASEREKRFRENEVIPDEELEKLEKIELIPGNKEKVLYVCPVCGTKDYADGLFFCEECGKLVCNNCGVFDNSDNMKKCDECW